MNIVEVRRESNNEEPTPVLYNLNKVKYCVEKIFSILNYDNVEISIIICDNAYIRDLNKRFRGSDEATDVLSFSQREGEGTPIVEHEENENLGGVLPLGDIVISEEMCKENADQYGTLPELEAKRLLVHGILHVHGMTHSNPEEYEAMISFQEHLLDSLSEVAIR